MIFGSNPAQIIGSILDLDYYLFDNQKDKGGVIPYLSKKQKGVE